MPIFLEFLSKEYAEATLQVWLEAHEISTLPSSQQEPAAKVCYKKFYGDAHDSVEVASVGQLHPSAVPTARPTAMSALQRKADEAIELLADNYFPRFLEDDKLSIELINSLLW